MERPRPKLVSFELCPYVQRSVILLNYKGIDFDIEYIDLNDPPVWFLAISPFGRVPVLQVGDQTLFESAIIAEYLDEVNPPSIHPADPLQKAVNRAWIELASGLFTKLYELVTAPDESAYTGLADEMKSHLNRLEAQLKGPFFNGEALALVDFNFAPFFMRLSLVDQVAPTGLLDGLEKTSAWARSLAELACVKSSVGPEFSSKYLGFMQSCGGYLSCGAGPR